ncbi:MAG: fused MFS/spermidine synthase [Candidatus Paceibacterota bacterium]|jgi:spermidine synthase
MVSSTWQYYLATFLSGFCLMTVEIISSRIVAPIIGSSIFTWTAVIGITLLGLSAGSLLGGELADRYIKVYGQKALALAMLAASFSVYLILPLSKHVGAILNGSLSVVAASILVCATLFLVPALVMGALPPMIFKLYAKDIQHIGEAYGLFSSIWSLGSIVGVFLTGFYFITTIGSSGTVSAVALVLLALFYFFYCNNLTRHESDFRRQVQFLLIVSVLVLLFSYSTTHAKRAPLARVLFSEETAYYDAKVVDYELFPEYGRNRILFLDIDAHSVQTEKPSKQFYTDIYPAFSAFMPAPKDIYVIGAGAYTLPINFRKQYPTAHITVSEIDPALEEIGRTYFNLGAYDIRTEVGDARVSLRAASGKYDLIFGDAYNSFISVPWHLLTKEFLTETADALNPDGVYAINFIGSLEGTNAEMFESVYSTMQTVFPNSYVFAFGNTPEEVQNITVLGVKNTQVLSREELIRRLDALDATHFLSSLVVDTKGLNDHTGIRAGLVLTDDFAPVERMMAGLMHEYFPKYLPLYAEVVS